MYGPPTPEESPPTVDPEQRNRIAIGIGSTALWRTVSTPFQQAWERLSGRGKSGPEILVSPEEQWAEVAAAQEGFRPEDAPYLAYDQLRTRYQISDTTESRLPASAVRDLAALERTEVTVDKDMGITRRRHTNSISLFTINGMVAAHTAARLEAGVTPSQYLRMNGKSRQRLDNNVFQRASALHGAFVHDVELAEAFDVYIGHLAPQLSPERRGEIEAGNRVLPWVLDERGQWRAREDAPASEYKKGQ
jgi:hypothetical protein